MFNLVVGNHSLVLMTLVAGDVAVYKASVGITTNMKVDSTKWIAKSADSLGVHSIWIGEDIGIGQEVFSLTASCLLHSSRVRVGTGIVPMSVHNISTIARAALSLQEIANGRFVLGTGIGGLQDLHKLGIDLTKPVTVLRDTVSTLRKLWAGETVNTHNQLFELDNYNMRNTGEVQIPIFLGVRGPQMLRLSGQIADGVILSGPPDYLRDAVDEINKAARKVGRTPDMIEKVAWLPTIPTFKGGKEKLAKKVVSIVVADMPTAVIDMLSIDSEKINRLREAVARGGPNAGIPFVDNEMMDTFTISGDCNHMVNMFERIVQLGVTEVVLGPPFSGDWRGAMTDIFEEITSRRDK
ncbi:MAG: LLM class flavin-dependent oxidoreductase [Candidatus Thorarchaeota archaeon]|nr:LLM class flavin-dependent oxidoreductase [Candidatus Thorarchaeota archaeon]